MGVVWAAAGGLIIYGGLKATMGLRLSQEEEYDGADLSIHRRLAPHLLAKPMGEAGAMNQ